MLYLQSEIRGRIGHQSVSVKIGHNGQAARNTHIEIPTPSEDIRPAIAKAPEFAGHDDIENYPNRAPASTRTPARGTRRARCAEPRKVGRAWWRVVLMGLTIGCSDFWKRG